ncbi:MAG TPA: hypothetical protein VHP33_15255 [Polyangiaceae bacterium]|nr:hypothetical protein [Polyangiaceae bacterium]
MRALLLIGLLGLSACRSQTLPSSDRPATSGATGAPSISSSPPAHARTRLYLPIAEQPFPQGATDDRVCAAVHSRETEPFFRFGHLLPTFKDGVVWIGQGSADELRRVEDAIDRYAPKMFISRSATCSRGGVLVYVEGMAQHVRALGRQYSPAELEASVYGAVPTAKEVLKERFLLSEKHSLPPLLAECRESAERCDQLTRLWPLDGSAAPRGLCNVVLGEARALFAKPDRSWATRADIEWDERALLEACNKLTPSDKVCALLDRTGPEHTACWKRLAPQLGW